MSARVFGTLKDGRPVRAFGLSRPGGLKLEVLEYGAVIRALAVPLDGERSVEVLTGFDDLVAYEADGHYHGALVGRSANRIAGARFTIDGQTSEVSANEGKNCLHGGWIGFNKRLFRAIRADGRGVTLAYNSADGEEGFPGKLDLMVTVTLPERDAMEIVWEATTAKPTPVNLSHHLYFNLAGVGSGPVLDHTLEIAADAYTPVKKGLLPTGEVAPVKGTVFDFRKARKIGTGLKKDEPQFAFGDGYDHNWALNPGEAVAARLRSAASGVTLEIETDQPGLQVYGGQGLAAPFGRHGAVALEPQNFPDAVNQPDFPDAVLRPGQTYRRRALYRFGARSPGKG